VEGLQEAMIDEAGLGFLGYLRVQHPGRLFTFGATAQFTDSHFRQLGMILKEVAPKLVAQAQLSHQISRAASVSIGYMTQQNRGKANFGAATGSMNWNIGGKTFLSSAVNYAPTLRNPFSATITLGIVLGARHSFTAGTDIQAGMAMSNADLTLQAPATRGFGYHVHSSSLGDTHIRTDTEVDWQNDMGSYRAQTTESAGKAAWALEETGGIAFMAGHVVPTRWLNDSFAIVEVPAGKDIRVFANNQPLTSTGKHGRALVPLVPYQQNVVHVDDENAPMDTDMDFSEKTVVPRPHSGVLVRIKAVPITGAVLLLTGEDGNPVPLGSRVRISGVEQVWEVALHGEVFIPAISLPAHLEVMLPDGKCAVTAPKPAEDEVLPRLGPLVCKKVRS
jgi:outer membrane usher protein